MQDLKAELKNTFTTYWHFLAVQKACQFNVFDEIHKKESTVNELAKTLSLNEKALKHLLSFLVEEHYLIQKNDFYTLSVKGELLTENHPDSLKNACLLWGMEHLNAWQDLDHTLQTGESSFESKYDKPFFDYLNDFPEKLRNYHLAMRDYAKDDYKRLPLICDFSNHQKIVDVGGGLGVLIGFIAAHCPQSECLLFELSEVSNLIKSKSQLPFEILEGDFFERLPFGADAIILSRVLHDWNDEKASLILNNCRKALKEGGRLYVLEILQDQIEAHLLSLNMMAICESHERTLQEYEQLLEKGSFQIKEQKKLNDLQTILICQ